MNDQAESTALVPTEPAPIQAETAVAAQSAMVRAQVEARYLVAYKCPRNMDQVRLDLLHDCKSTAFAKEALYRLPFGKEKAEGFSIRFAEAALGHMGNIDTRVVTVFDDELHVIVNATVSDLQRNTSYSTDIEVEKTVERKWLKEGQQPLGTRLNSYDERVYLVPATEHDMRRKINAEVSKAIRTNGLRLVPAGLKEECMRTIKAVLEAEVTQDPDAAKKQLIDAFASIGVKPNDLGTYLSHDLDGATPAELVELRTVYVAVRNGAVTWREALVANTGVESDGEEDANADIKEKIAKVQADLAAKKKARASSPGKGKGKKRPPKSEAKAAAEERPNPDVFHTDEEARKAIAAAGAEAEPPPGAGDAWEPGQGS